LREGIADFEKIRILRERVAATGGRVSDKARDQAFRRLLAQLDEHLALLTAEHTFTTDTLKMQVYEGESLIKELSNYPVGR
jgi:hypothetical protein